MFCKKLRQRRRSQFEGLFVQFPVNNYGIFEKCSSCHSLFDPILTSIGIIQSMFSSSWFAYVFQDSQMRLLAFISELFSVCLIFRKLLFVMGSSKIFVRAVLGLVRCSKVTINKDARTNLERKNTNTGLARASDSPITGPV